MKVVKVHIRRGGVGEDQMVYPARYNAREVDRRGFGPLNLNGTDAYSGGIGMGEAEEWCLIALDDALADEYAKDPEMEIVATPDEADTLMASWHAERVARGFAPAERVVDPVRIQAIRAKQEAGIALSEDDLRALDPLDDTPGVNSRPRSVVTRLSGARA